MNIPVFIYVFLIACCMAEKNYLTLAIVILTIPVTVIIYKTYKKNKINNFKALIEQAKSDNSISPFLDINKEPAYILELIPGVKEVYALRISNQRRKRLKFNSFVEFADFCDLEPYFYEINKKILKF